MNKYADVIVIGSGIMGSSTAYCLAKQGVKVLVLERDSVGNGATSRCGAGVRLSSRVSPESDLAEEAIKNIWPTLSEELGVDLEYEKPGGLSLAYTDSQIKDLENDFKKCKAAGVNAKIISGDDARQICPYLSSSVVKARWSPDDGYANPMVTTLAYYRKARMMGVHYITGEDIIAIEKQKGQARKVVTKAGNIYEADKIVLAAGFNSRRIAESVGIHLPFLKRIDECVITEVQPAMFKYRISTADGTFYGHQTKHGSFIFGGNTNLERYEKTYDAQPRSTASSSANKCSNIMKHIPALAEAKIIRQWAGWLDSCVDRLPVIQEIPEVPGLVLACGFSGHGFAIGPAVGKVVSEIVLGQKTSVDVSKLAYDRFKAGGVGRFGH